MNPDAIQTLADKLAIQEVTARYFWAVDEAEAEAYLAVWAADGISEAAGMGNATGHAELRARFEKNSQGFSKGKRHVVANFVIDVQGDIATQRVYLVVFEREQAGRVVATAAYDDELRKTDGTWRFTRRRQTLDPNAQKSNQPAQS